MFSEEAEKNERASAIYSGDLSGHARDDQGEPTSDGIVFERSEE
jgi:hypothetical protein